MSQCGLREQRVLHSSIENNSNTLLNKTSTAPDFRVVAKHNRLRQNHPKSYIKKTIPTKVRPFSNTYIWVKNMVKFWGHVSRPSRALQARDHFGPRQLKGINERIVLPHNLTFKGYISTLNQPEVVIIVNFETFTYWFLYFWCFFFTRMTKNPVGKGVNPIEYQDIVKIGQFCLLILIKVVP